MKNSAIAMGNYFFTETKWKRCKSGVYFWILFRRKESFEN